MSSTDKIMNHDCKEQTIGLVAVTTNQALLIGEYDGNTQAPEIGNVLESLAHYLIELNY
jgi:hypothetical protein